MTMTSVDGGVVLDFESSNPSLPKLLRMSTAEQMPTAPTASLATGGHALDFMLWTGLCCLPSCQLSEEYAPSPEVVLDEVWSSAEVGVVEVTDSFRSASPIPEDAPVRRRIRP